MISFPEKFKWNDLGVWKWKTSAGHACLRTLEPYECDVAREVFKEIEGASEVLFREENLSGLARRYAPHDSFKASGEKFERKLAKIAEALFFFGDKGKHFWDKPIIKSSVLKLLETLNIGNDEAIECLLEKICIARSKEAVLLDFFNQRKSLSEALDRLRGNWQRVLVTLHNCEKRKLRDLLIFFLHNYSTRRFSTALVSMTSDLEIALRFASTEKDSHDGCVIAGFLPPKWHDKAVRLTDIQGCHKLLCRIALPLESFANHKHSEVALFGGIFPHYSIWLMDLKNKVIIWSPSIFEVEKMERRQIPWSGIPIDQTDFLNRLGKETALACGLARDEGGDIEIFPNGKQSSCG